MHLNTYGVVTKQKLLPVICKVSCHETQIKGKIVQFSGCLDQGWANFYHRGPDCFVSTQPMARMYKLHF